MKRGAGFPPATLWTPLSSRTSVAAILTGLGPQVPSLEEGYCHVSLHVSFPLFYFVVFTFPVISDPVSQHLWVRPPP